MAIDASWVGAIASMASALVIAVTAVAAFLQLRHMQNTNEINVYLKMVERIDSLESESTFAGIEPLIERMESDPSFRLRLTQPGIFEEVRALSSLLQFLEHLSTLVVTGGITERLVLAEYADNINSLWDRLAEMIYLRRVAYGPYFVATFEHVAMRAKKYLADGEMQRLYGRLEKDPRMAAFVPPSQVSGSKS